LFGTLNGVLSPVVQEHSILESQVLDLNALQQQKDLWREAMLRNPETTYLASDEEFDKSWRSDGHLPIWSYLGCTSKRNVQYRK
jgi:hypothetical protein